ncbi:MAG: hypothetical protein IPH82_29550 [Chloroflexi bacterium]|nr:hypothetical protein [Chloroflexota bacterium]
MTVDLLEEVLPLSTNVAAVFRQTQTVGQRLEDVLGGRTIHVHRGLPEKGAQLPPPQSVFVGIDGGFEARLQKKTGKLGGLSDCRQELAE